MIVLYLREYGVQRLSAPDKLISLAGRLAGWLVVCPFLTLLVTLQPLLPRLPRSVALNPTFVSRTSQVPLKAGNGELLICSIAEMLKLLELLGQLFMLGTARNIPSDTPLHQPFTLPNVLTYLPYFSYPALPYPNSPPPPPSLIPPIPPIQPFNLSPPNPSPPSSSSLPPPSAPSPPSPLPRSLPNIAPSCETGLAESNHMWPDTLLSASYFDRPLDWLP